MSFKHYGILIRYETVEQFIEQVRTLHEQNQPLADLVYSPAAARMSWPHSSEREYHAIAIYINDRKLLDIGVADSLLHMPLPSLSGEEQTLLLQLGLTTSGEDALETRPPGYVLGQRAQRILARFVRELREARQQCRALVKQIKG